MLFCTKEFCAFFALVLMLYWALPWKQARVYLLLAASFYFYASANIWLALLIVVSTSIDFWLARGIESSTNPRRRKLLLLVNIVGNLGLLCFFKYVNFFLDNIKEALLAAGGDVSSMRPLEIFLPVGISFYTFEAISYMVDVYRGRVKAEKNLAHFQLFILFFPHLVAGPIVRGRDFLPQVARHKRFSWNRFLVGCLYFVMGFFKKSAIADRLAQFVDPIFDDPSGFKSYAVWVGVIAYALQIYCDFSGYTDMALGCAHMLGYKLSLNFNMPYLAVNVSDFWRRWHISLSSWLRDYLFIPLGGSRGGQWATCRNLMLTMILGGLWHGASWTFVFWGFLHGSYLVIHRFFRVLCDRTPLLERGMKSLPGTVLSWALTMTAVLVGWVFFRAQSFSTATSILDKMAFNLPGRGPIMHDLGLWMTVVLVMICHATAALGLWRRWWQRIPAPVLGTACALIVTLGQVLAPPNSAPFIYFQF